MPGLVVRVYDHLSDAQNARHLLLQSGFEPSSISLSANHDEAGPVEGNGILDDKDKGTGPRGAPLGAENRTGAYNSSEPIWRSSVMLTVDADDDEQWQRACRIMDSCGAADVSKRSERRKRAREGAHGSR